MRRSLARLSFSHSASRFCHILAASSLKHQQTFVVKHKLTLTCYSSLHTATTYTDLCNILMFLTDLGFFLDTNVHRAWPLNYIDKSI